MSEHLSDQGVSMYLIGVSTPEQRRHAEECPECKAKLASLIAPLAHFRGAVRNWSERAAARERAAELRWTVIPAIDHLERMLLPASFDVPWYRSLWSNLRDLAAPACPLLDITSKPVLVRDIWGQYGRQKKSWVMSLALQSAVVLLLFTVFSSKAVQQQVRQVATLIMPVDLDAYQPKMAPKHQAMGGGGGGGDHSPLPASQGKLPKASLKQFTPPMAVVNNPDPRLAMEPSIIAPPDVALPQVNMSQYGDPLARIGPPSNGPGSGGGIGSGSGGGVGSGKGAGFGPGDGGGIGGGVYRAGGGVTSPSLISKVEPEYSEAARKAKYQGTVILYVEVDPSGRPTNIKVERSLGLGLDEKAIEAVRKWKFRPGYKDGRPVTVAATVQVNFRLL
jgi:periplasmic protein TonB